MEPLYIQVAHMMAKEPSNTYAVDSFDKITVGYSRSAASGALKKLVKLRLVECADSKRPQSVLGRNLVLYKIIKGKEAKMLELKGERKSPKDIVREKVFRYPNKSFYNSIQKWLDNITMGRLSC